MEIEVVEEDLVAEEDNKGNIANKPKRGRRKTVEDQPSLLDESPKAVLAQAGIVVGYPFPSINGQPEDPIDKYEREQREADSIAKEQANGEVANERKRSRRKKAEDQPSLLKESVDEDRPSELNDANATIIGTLPTVVVGDIQIGDAVFKDVELTVTPTLSNMADFDRALETKEGFIVLTPDNDGVLSQASIKIDPEVNAHIDRICEEDRQAHEASVAINQALARLYEIQDKLKVAIFDHATKAKTAKNAKEYVEALQEHFYAAVTEVRDCNKPLPLFDKPKRAEVARAETKAEVEKDFPSKPVEPKLANIDDFFRRKRGDAAFKDMKGLTPTIVSILEAAGYPNILSLDPLFEGGKELTSIKVKGEGSITEDRSEKILDAIAILGVGWKKEWDEAHPAELNATTDPISKEE